MDVLKQTLGGAFEPAQVALDKLWQALPASPQICWYPSAGNCFRDLLIWNHYPALADVPEPDLYIHTDYARPGMAPGLPGDDRTRISILARYLLTVTPDIDYRVDPAFASLAGRASSEPIVELFHVRAESAIVGVIEKPVLYFHFENFNWFEQFVLQRGLNFTHLFKVREGCGMGGARASVSNLYPFLAQAGCRHMVADQEVHVRARPMVRYLRRYARQGTMPFSIEDLGAIGRLSDKDVRAFRINSKHGLGDNWLHRAFATITRNSAWEDSMAELPAIGPYQDEALS